MVGWIDGWTDGWTDDWRITTRSRRRINRQTDRIHTNKLSWRSLFLYYYCLSFCCFGEAAKKTLEYWWRMHFEDKMLLVARVLVCESELVECGSFVGKMTVLSTSVINLSVISHRLPAVQRTPQHAHLLYIKCPNHQNPFYMGKKMAVRSTDQWMLIDHSQM